MFDIRALREGQVPDVYGNKIPLDLDSGQFYWSVTDSRPGAHFSGRSEIVSIGEKVSSSYSCWQCCPDSLLGWLLSTLHQDIGIGQDSGLSPEQFMGDCYQNTHWEIASPGSFGGFDTSVVSVDTDPTYGNSWTTGEGEGTTSIHALWDSSAWDYFEPDPPNEFDRGHCEDVPVSADADTEQQVEAPTLVATPASVTRGGSTTFEIKKIDNLAPGVTATASLWVYTPTSNNEVSRSTNTSATTWSGVMVSGGTAKVHVVITTSKGPKPFDPPVSFTVNPRTGWSWSTPSPSEQFTGLFNFVVPPTLGDRVGVNVPGFGWNGTPTAVSDNGPNHGLKSLASLTSTSFDKWRLSPALDPSNDFYQHQCGNFTGLTGFIGGSTLRTNAFEHEAGVVSSHWTMLDFFMQQNNPGVVGETILGNANDSAFNTTVTNKLSTPINQIISDLQTEPQCNPTANWNKNCLFDGPGNFRNAQGQYASCTEGVTNGPFALLLLGGPAHPGPTAARVSPRHH